MTIAEKTEIKAKKAYDFLYRCGEQHLYPELKGKDPQERTWNEREKYPIIGSVVHAVSPRVDDGRIISSVHYSNRASTKDELYSMLKKSSLEPWIS